MVAEVIFQFGPDIILVKVSGSSVLFGSAKQGAKLGSIDGLKLNKKGVEKEFPDLAGNPLWKEEAIFRFKEKIKGFKSEKERIDYIIDDLKKHGYVSKKLRISGWRDRNLWA